MNLPNKLTVSRLLLTVVFVVCFYLPMHNARSFALLLFAVASITDYLDGSIARSRNLVTNFGKLFDPLADKILITAALILLVEKSNLPAWIAIVILAREFFVTGIRLVAANHGVVLAAEKLGKHKMVWQIVTVIYFLLRDAAQEPLFGSLRPFFDNLPVFQGYLGAFIVYFTTLLTLVSGFSYFWKNRSLFNDA
ncbi:MAG: CDP-diacylglycerol--glycerol-3-phosphate 3-phosphatidyltransferase [Verrucomicrobiales bacterium]|nr:CDP-diacylglycerol--glycerol-3-phosphate 3-phosphatidyltransferase [Verrucomicrobiales bacterium]MCP5559048.1 CDP-diacylglycerol--glycerol-3-phosphate 3-phosphatidyltransferase [Verrucomicrobiaceae bacterium]